MTRSSALLRLLSTTVATAVTLAMLAAPPAGAAIAADRAATVDAAAGYLVDQLVDGTHLEGDFGPQYGPTADVAYGLLAAGAEGETLNDVLAYMVRPETVDAYVHGQPFDGTTVEDPAYVGATAKLGLLVTVAGMDPRATGGTDLVATLQSLENEESGRFEDRSDFGNFANLFGQSFGLVFLHAAEGVAPSDASIRALLDAQCEDGGFPQDYDQDTCTSQPDATGMALQALALTGDRVEGGTAAATAAADWLRGAQDDDGAWNDPQNTNSTGYAGMGLLSVDRDVTAAQAFLAGIQNEDGGLPVSPGGDSDPLATAQALPLLATSTFTILATGPGIPTPDGLERIFGPDRVQTAIQTSRAMYPRPGSAGTVVLTRANTFADGLTGAALAVQADGPLLLTPSAELHDDVLAEISRVLPVGSTVHVLGGVAALSTSIAETLEDAGYEVLRIAGADRYATSVAIAEYLGDPGTLLLATGRGFADPLTAGAAAGAVGGAVLLTADEQADSAVSAYLDGRGDATVVAVGGPAARAHPDADESLIGVDRDATAVAVAERFFETPRYLGVARRDFFADALGGGVQAGRLGVPLLLTAADDVPAVIEGYLCSVRDGVAGAAVWGGVDAIGEAAVGELLDRLAGRDC